MKVDDQQEELMAALDELLQQFGNYGPARVRGDGDIQIPLDFDLKARTRRSNLADAFLEDDERDLAEEKLDLGQ